MFTGVFAALMTPFNDNGDLWEEHLQRHVEILVEAGVDGLYLCGNSGQGLYLSVEERCRIAELVQEQVAGRIALIAHELAKVNITGNVFASGSVTEAEVFVALAQVIRKVGEQVIETAFIRFKGGLVRRLAKIVKRLG